MDRLQCRDHFLTILRNAASQRAKRNKWVFDPFEGMNVLEWVIYERKLMLDEVNRFRESKGLDPVGENDILRVEQLAVGHVDYAEKFSLYCAELSDGVEEIQP